MISKKTKNTIIRTICAIVVIGTSTEVMKSLHQRMK